MFGRKKRKASYYEKYWRDYAPYAPPLHSHHLSVNQLPQHSQSAGSSAPMSKAPEGAIYNDGNGQIYMMKNRKWTPVQARTKPDGTWEFNITSITTNSTNSTSVNPNTFFQNVPASTASGTAGGVSAGPPPPPPPPPEDTSDMYLTSAQTVRDKLQRQLDVLYDLMQGVEGEDRVKIDDAVYFLKETIASLDKIINGS